MYTANVDQEAVKCIGDLKLLFRNPAPINTASDHGDWNIAWYTVGCATVFVFLHLKEDQDAYAEHNLGFFSACLGNSAYHDRVGTRWKIEAQKPLTDPARMTFARAQCDGKVPETLLAGFVTMFRPGMSSAHAGLVPKLQADKIRVIVGQCMLEDLCGYIDDALS
ncbi:hypothetical protein GGG16DRAFT_107022 [Schizophyllum commune]